MAARKKARRAPKEPSLGKIVQIVIGKTPANPEEPTVYALTEYGEVYFYRVEHIGGEEIGVWIQMSSLIPDAVFDPDEEEDDPDQDAEEDDE